MVNRQIHTLLLILSLLGKPAFSQYILNGSATPISCNCYQLTGNNTFESGSVWNGNKINLQQPFDFTFNVYLGCNDQGADGMVFMLQPVSTNLGASGEGMGFQGVVPSIGITLDTYQNFNLNDPSFDHIAIQANGNPAHTAADLTPPVPISATSSNVEDCQWHTLRINWNPVNNMLATYFDGVLRASVQQDIIALVFNNDPMVYWGFSAATGGASNIQQFCTALNPDFTVNFSGNDACAPATVSFSDLSESFAPITSYHWDFGNGQTSNLPDPPAQTYSQAGNYQVRLNVKGLDGCENDTVKTVTVGSLPEAQMQAFDTCFGNIPRISFIQQGTAINYQWLLNGSPVTGTPTPLLVNLAEGQHQLQLIALSELGCGAADTNTVSFLIKPLPQTAIDYDQACETLSFSAVQLDNQTSIQKWNWDFGNNQSSQLQNPVHQFQQGQYTVQLVAQATNGCTAATVSTVVDIPAAIAFAGNDTTIIKGQPFRLNASGNGDFLWSPSLWLNNPAIPDPVATLTGDMNYVLTVTTGEGCVAKDTIRIKVYPGPAVFVPTVFTPNGNGLNDILKPVYVGIRKLKRFSIYNRWGQLVFTTSDMQKGWDGSLQQKPQAAGTYIWLAQAINNSDQPIILKGTVTVIR